MAKGRKDEPEKIEVPFGKHGTLIAYRHADDNYPGICIMFRPEGRTEEIDLAYIKGIPTEEEAFDGEKAGDISIITYGNPWQEDYTHRETFQADEALEAVDSRYA